VKSLEGVNKEVETTMLFAKASRLAQRNGKLPSISLTKRSKHFVPRISERKAEEAGPGGRHSNAGVTVAIFGASGFLARYVCSKLGANGVLAYLGNRGDEFEMRWLKPCFDLGRTRFVFYSSRDVDSMREVIADADVVINMIGKHYETKHLTEIEKFPFLSYQTNYTYREANVDIPRTVAELCTEMQVDNLIHVSSLAASPDSKSEWARCKYEGEMAVKKAYPWATIIRPAHIFGYEDRLLNWFAIFPKLFPIVPLIDGGNALTQPVFMNDVADVIARVVDEPEKFEGQTIDLFGPTDYSYKELSQFVYDITGQKPNVLHVPHAVAKAVAKITQYQPNPMLTPDMVDLFTEDYIPSMTAEQYKSSDIFTFEDFGITPTPIEKTAFEYLHRHRVGGHFLLTEGYHAISNEKASWSTRKD